MAEDQDPAQKTEEPTQKRIEESRRKGQVATSREVNHWFIILGATLLVIMLFPGMLGDIKGTLVKFIASPHDITVDAGTVHAVVASLLADIGSILAVPAIILMALAVFGMVALALFGDALDRRLAEADVPPAVVAQLEDERAKLAGAEAPAGLDPAVTVAVEDAIDWAFVDAFRGIMLIGALLAFASSLTALVSIEGRPARRPQAAAGG